MRTPVTKVMLKMEKFMILILITKVTLRKAGNFMMRTPVIKVMLKKKEAEKNLGEVILKKIIIKNFTQVFVLDSKP